MMRSFGGVPALPDPSDWFIDPEPDPDAARFPRRVETAAEVVPTSGAPASGADA